MPISILYVPCPDAPVAQNLLDQLLAERLVACGNHFAASSSFFWKGAIQKDAEQILVMKTPAELADRARARAEELHPYETPCVLCFRAEANQAFADWARSVTGPV